MEAMSGAYQPGVCNINTAEIAKRRRIGRAGLAAFAVLLIALLLLSISRYYRIILVLPAMLCASGYLQARNHVITSASDMLERAYKMPMKTAPGQAA